MRRPAKRGGARTSPPQPPPPRLRAGRGGRRRGRQAPAPGEVRGGGECEGDPGLPGSWAVCSGPKDGARPWPVLPARRARGNPQIRVQKAGFAQFRRSEASEGLNLGVRGRWGTWASLGRDTLSLKESCSDWQDGEGCARVAWARPVHWCRGEPEEPWPRTAPFPWKQIYEALQPSPSTPILHLTHWRVTDALRPSLACKGLEILMVVL